MSKETELADSIGGYVDELISIIEDLREEVKSLEEQKKNLEEKVENLEEDELHYSLHEFGAVNSLQDELKIEVLVNLYRNCSLADIEELQRIEMESKKYENKTYLTF